MLVRRKEVFIEHWFELGLYRILDCLEIGKFKEDQVFNKGHFYECGYNTYGFYGFNFVPVEREDEGSPRHPLVCKNKCKNRGYVEFEYV